MKYSVVSFLIYNIVLVSGIRHSDSDTYFFHILFHFGYFNILNIVLCAVPEILVYLKVEMEVTQSCPTLSDLTPARLLCS